MGTTLRTGTVAALSLGAVVLTTSAARSGPVPVLKPGIAEHLPQIPPTAKRVLTLPYSPRISGVQPSADMALKRTLNGANNTCAIGAECLLYGYGLGKHGAFSSSPEGVTLTYAPVPTPATTITPKPPTASSAAPMPAPAPKPLPGTAPSISVWTNDLVGFPLGPSVAPGNYKVSIHKGTTKLTELTVRFVANGGRDADGDGHASAETGGDDCDDLDGRRYPGNTEVADNDDHDEDCVPSTYGNRDIDQDGAPDALACNVRVVGTGLDRTLEYHCGSDCDDSQPGILPGAMICDPRTDTAIFVCRGAPLAAWPTDPRRTPGMDWDPYDCASFVPGGHCVRQPNGTGVCR